MLSRLTDFSLKVVVVVAIVAAFSVTTAVALGTTIVNALGTAVGIISEALPDLGTSIQEGQDAVRARNGGEPTTGGN